MEGAKSRWGETKWEGPRITQTREIKAWGKVRRWQIKRKQI